MLNKAELEKIIINSDEDLNEFDGKSFSNKYIILKGVFKTIKLDTLERCVIEGGGIVCHKLSKCNLYDVEDVCAEEVLASIFQNCQKIQCGEIDEFHKVMANQFLNCGTIVIADAAVEDCIFNKFTTVFLTNTSMCGCVFSNTICNKGCVLSVEDGELSGCAFENIKLLNDTYLIKGYGKPWVNGCVFTNICTSREDYEIANSEDKRCDEVIDIATSTGLGLIMNLEGKINTERFLEFCDEEEQQ